MKNLRLLSILLVATMCGGIALGQTSRAGAGGNKSKAGKGENQGLDAMFRSLGTEQKPGGAQAIRGWWGVKVQARTLNVEEGEPAIPAAEVLYVKPGSPASAAGLRKGDMIVGIQMQQLTSSADLDRAVAAFAPGGRLSLQIWRAGEPVDLTLTRDGSAATDGLADTAQPAISPAARGGTLPGGRTGVFINGREITPAQAQQLRATYGYVAPSGQYWYDTASGLYGMMGREAAGFMQPGHDFGPLPANASNGTTGVYINGRQINMAEAMYCQRLFGAVYQGRWWLDGRTGNLGAEGNPMPLTNVYAALRQSQRSSQGGGGYSWHSKVTGASGGSDGNCSYVSIPGSGSVMTGNCD